MMDNWKLALSASAALASGIVVGTIISNRNNSSKPNIRSPKKWVRVGTVSNLILYPVKSCQGIQVEEAVATTIGLKASDYLRDRVFMVVDERCVFQTQRTIPKMTLIHVAVNGNQLTLSARMDMDPVVLDIPERNTGVKKTCRIFDDTVAEALDCGDAVGKWLDSFLGKSGLRLVYHSLEKTQRSMTNLQKKFPSFVPSDKGAFQDQTSYMLMSDKSIEELNLHLTTKVSHRNFRPSILIKEALEPFGEDFWAFVKIGESGPILKASKPCTRCKLTTVNPETGEFNPKGEPLSKLVQMQRSMADDKVDTIVKGQGIIGLQLGLFHGGGQSIKVGDPVYAAVL